MKAIIRKKEYTERKGGRFAKITEIRLGRLLLYRKEIIPNILSREFRD